MEHGRVEAGVAGRTQVGRDADDVVEVVECRAGRGELPRGWQLLVLRLLLRLLPWLLLWLLLAVNRRPQVNCAYASRRCNAAAGDLGEGGVNDLVAVSLLLPLGPATCLCTAVSTVCELPPLLGPRQCRPHCVRL